MAACAHSYLTWRWRNSKELPIVAINEALQTPVTIDPRKSKVVELCFFGGLSIEETAEALQVSPDTILLDWKFSKSWLLRELSPNDQHGKRGNRTDLRIRR
jgi:hypothetical protein